MKKVQIVFCLVLVILSVIESNGKIIKVGSSEPVTRITQAIFNSNTGDTILVSPGIYREGNIYLQKSITLIGENYPVLDGENKVEILTIHANNVVVKGFKFINSGVASLKDLAAIKILQSSGVQIHDNKLENNFFGIYLSNSYECRVDHNELHATALEEHQIGNGIHMWKCHDIRIDQNKINGHRDGIYFEFVTNSLITGNYSEGNKRYGLHFMFSHNNEYRDNTFINNGAGVAVMYTKGVKMINNHFIHNWGSASYGLLLKDISDSYVVGNEFSENSIGIFIEGGSRIQFKENEFTRNGYAIKLQANCDDNVLERNNFQQNTFDLVTNGTLVLNKIDGNYWDRYEGYDLDRDQIGDVPYRPIGMYGMIVERMPTAVLLWRSFLVFLLDRAERAIPVITPENMKDNLPSMKAYDFNKRPI